MKRLTEKHFLIIFICYLCIVSTAGGFFLGALFLSICDYQILTKLGYDYDKLFSDMRLMKDTILKNLHFFYMAIVYSLVFSIIASYLALREMEVKARTKNKN